MSSKERDVLEAFLGNVVALAQSYVTSVALLLRHPIRGPIRLALRRRRGIGTQVGPYTMLFVTSIVLLLYVLRNAELRELATKYMGAGVAPTEVRPLIIGAVVGTLSLGLGARLIAWIITGGSAVHRERTVEALLYAYSSQVLLLIALALVLQKVGWM